MLVKVHFYERLLHFLFKGRENEVKLFVEDRVSLKFSKKEKFLFEIGEKDLSYLNTIIDEFKTNFKYCLDLAPPPFSFFIVKNPKQKIQAPFLRSGKIYFTSDVEKEVKKALKKVGFYYKIEPWFGVFELLFPVTVDPNVLFPFKDVFWGGNHPPCFFCGSTLHSFTSCPGLKVADPRENMKKLLNLNFSEIGEILRHSLKKGFKDENVFLFYNRYFYLFPAFLKIVFFKGDELKSWNNFLLEARAPVIAGDIGRDLEIGLEYLLKGNLKKAKVYFEGVEEDYRASLGLFFVSLFEKEFDQAIYYLENVLEKIDVPFIKSYTLFLKARLHQYRGDRFAAEEMYKEAMKVDSACLPAYYHHLLLKYEDDKDLKVFGRLVEHIYVMYWMFLDPLFIKDQKALEEWLLEKVSEKREIALQRLKEVEKKFNEVKKFLRKEKLKEYEEKLKDLAEKIYHGGIRAIEIASDKALELELEFQAVFCNRVKEIKARLEDLKKDYAKLRHFWNSYPYKASDPYFRKRLKELAEVIEKVNKKIKSPKLNKMLTLVIKEVETGEKLVEELLSMKEELRKKWIFRKRLESFLKNFSLLEGTWLTFYIVLSYLSQSSSVFLNPFTFFLISFSLMVFCLINAYFQK